jgi:hypothetical protein
MSKNVETGEDGLPRTIVGEWTREKHERLVKYVDITRAVRRKWMDGGQQTTYIELFCGPGQSRIKRTRRTVIVDRLAALRASTGPFATPLTPTIISPPAAPAATFAILQGAVTANGATLGTPPALAITRIRKALPPSYFAVGGAPPDGNVTTTDDDFGCAIRGTPASPIPLTPLKTVTWGQVISYALRQPALAMKLGLVYQLSVTLSGPNAQALAVGGWVFAALAASDPWALAAQSNAGSLRTHAARIPPLGAARRALFAAINYPVDGEGTVSAASFGVSDEYADGFAKLVHCAQPMNSAAAVGDGQLAPGSDLGIEIGWDDQQVTQWQNDQLNLLQARTGGTLATATQMPLGVQGYRVDVADITPLTPGGAFLTPVFQSLCNITTTLPSPLGTYIGDLCLEPVATQPNSGAGADAWLPRYFATWRGGSLCETRSGSQRAHQSQGPSGDSSANRSWPDDAIVLRAHLRVSGSARRSERRRAPHRRRPYQPRHGRRHFPGIPATRSA